MSKVPAVVEILSIEVAASFLNGLQFGAPKNCGKNRVVETSTNFANLQDEFIGSLLCHIVTRGPTSKVWI